MMLFVDSFGHYTDAFLTKKWDVRAVDAGFGGSVTQGLTSGRFGGGGVTFVAPTSGLINDHPYYIQKNYDAVSVIICGFAIQQTTTQGFRGGRLLTFVDGSTSQVAIDVLQSGQLRATRSTNPGTGIILEPSGSSPDITTLGTSINAIASSSFDFLEFKITHHPTAGIVEVKRNGAPFWTLANQNTAISGANQSASVVVGGYTSFNGGVGANMALQAIISDFHLLNTTVNGSDANDPVDFIGDRHWEVLTPTADGFYTAWSPTGSASHFANIDEIPPSVADFNSTSTVDAKDTFIVQDSVGLLTASAIVCLTMYIEKTTGGANEVKGLARLGGVDRLGTAFQVPSPVAVRQSFSATDPAGNPWTVANYNSSEQGYQKTV